MVVPQCRDGMRGTLESEEPGRAVREPPLRRRAKACPTIIQTRFQFHVACAIGAAWTIWNRYHDPCRVVMRVGVCLFVLCATPLAAPTISRADPPLRASGPQEDVRDFDPALLAFVAALLHVTNGPGPLRSVT